MILLLILTLLSSSAALECYFCSGGCVQPDYYEFIYTCPSDFTKCFVTLSDGSSPEKSLAMRGCAKEADCPIYNSCCDTDRCNPAARNLFTPILIFLLPLT